MILDRDSCRRGIASGARPHFRGRVSQVSGLVVEAEGVPAAMGELCRIDRGALGVIDAEAVEIAHSAPVNMTR